jgi:hypothetical protein
MFYKPRGSDFLHKKVRPDGQSIPTGYPSFWALSSLANTVPVFKNETVDWNGVPIEDQPEPCVVKSKIGLGHPWLKDKDGEWTDWCFC